MSQNNTIRKSDKKFIRLEKARIRRQFLDFKKQEELINELYKKFLGKPEVKEVKEKNILETNNSPRGAKGELPVSKTKQASVKKVVKKVK